MTDFDYDAPVFSLEGPLGTAQLFRDDLGFRLYFEGPDSYKAEAVRTYATRVGIVGDAFEDAKEFVGLEGWDMNWEKFYEECKENA